MNKSLEKIRDIKSLINEVYQGELSECARKSWLCFQQDCDDIKQDLELLEQLKQQRDSLAINNGELCVKVTDLQKENQELKRYKEKAILYDKACNKDKSANKIIVDLDYLENLQNEERKFGFAIEILTRVANIKTEKHLTRLYEHKYISKEDYELLKEVLGNER